MDVLFLDDSPERAKHFRSIVPSAVFVTTAEECIAELGKRQWDYVFLDHDLGGEVYVDTAEKNTGSEVVRWIGKHRPQIGQIVVHSCNYDAAMYMVIDLIAAGYEAWAIPWPNLRCDNDLMAELAARQEGE
jgi:CheY-like chemotaxis protein